MALNQYLTDSLRLEIRHIQYRHGLVNWDIGICHFRAIVTAKDNQWLETMMI